MIIPTDEEIEDRVRDFIRSIPRRVSPPADDSVEGGGGARKVSDDAGGTYLPPLDVPDPVGLSSPPYDGLPFKVNDDNDNEVDGPSTITFTRDAYPDADDEDDIVEDPGDGTVIVHLPGGFISVTGDDADGGDLGIDNVAQLNLIGAVKIEDGGLTDDMTGEQVDVTIGLDVQDDDGHNGADFTNTLIFIGWNDTTVEETGDGETTVNILPDPEGDSDHQKVLTTDGTDVFWDVGGSLEVLDAFIDVDPVNSLEFLLASESDDADIIVQDDGDGAASVILPAISVGDGAGNLVDTPVRRINFKTPDAYEGEPIDIVDDGGSGVAEVEIPMLGVSGSDDGDSPDAIDFMFFIGWGDPTVEDGGDGGVTINILPPIDGLDGEGPWVLSTDGGSVFWMDTSDCGDSGDGGSGLMGRLRGMRLA